MTITRVSDPDQTEQRLPARTTAFGGMPRRLAACALLGMVVGCLASSGKAWSQEKPQRLPAITLTAGMHLISAEVAQTPEQRAIGLMHRREMPPHAGMLFVFEQPAAQCFWMKNTLLPLSIAFLDDDGTIVNVEEMKPLSLDSHCSAKPVRLALEMNAGWFSKKGLGPGAKLGGSVFRGRAP